MAAESFVMRVDKVWRLGSRQHVVVSGPRGQLVLRLGDRVRLHDEHEVVHAVVAGIGLHSRPGELDLTLADADGEPREGQVVYRD